MNHIFGRIGLDAQTSNLQLKKIEIQHQLITLLQVPPYRFAKFSEIFTGCEVENLWIQEMKISTRTKNVLVRSEILNLNQLWNLTPRDILDIRNAGFGTFEEICAELIASISVKELNLNLPITLVAQKATQKKIINSENVSNSIHESLDYMLRNINSEEIDCIKENVAQILNYPLNTSKHFTLNSFSKTDQKYLKIKLLNCLKSSAISELIHSDFEVLTLDEIWKVIPEIRLGLSAGFSSISVFEVLVYLGILESFDGYIFLSSEMTSRQKSIFQDAWRESLDIAILKERCQGVEIRISPSVSEFFEATSATRRKISRVHELNENLSDLNGVDYWIEDLKKKRGDFDLLSE